MRTLGALILLAPVFRAVSAAEAPRPRGVGPEFAKFYKAADIFTCISNPAIHIPFSLVNDDYCDCPDGSDEPGTSACSYLSPLSPRSPAHSTLQQTGNITIALPGFYCKNKGHQPSYLPFTNVNDGVCDYDLCCDGSDEYDGVGGVKCQDRCNEIGKEWRKQNDLRQKAVGAAGKRRKELVAEAARLKKEVQDMITDLEAVIHGAELKVSQAETELAEIERKEKDRIVTAPGKAGKLSTLAGFAQDRIEELRGSLIRVREERDAGRERLWELETMLSTLKLEYNPNFNDEGVKRAVRAWDEYVARPRGPDSDPAFDRDLDEFVKPDQESEGGIRWDEWQDDEQASDAGVLYQFENYLPAILRSWLDPQLRKLRSTLIENGILARPDEPTSSTESKSVTDARNRLKAQQDTLNTNRNSLRQHKEDLEKDYGKDDIFRAMKGQCISKDSGEYTYELCWLDKTTQKQKKGATHTGMGTYARMETVTVDEEVPPDGKGLGSGELLALKYENGQHCWNGPNRRTTVVLACAEKDEIWKIMEEEKCVYRMEVGTPAVCDAELSKGKEAGNVKDEL